MQIRYIHPKTEACTGERYTDPSGATGRAIMAETAGRTGGCTVLPFASGSPILLTTVADGVPGIPAFIAFGYAAAGSVPLGGSLDLTTQPHPAFPIPRSGTITSLAAYFQTAGPCALADTTLSITAQLYISAAGDLFTPLPDASLLLAPALHGSVAAGTVCSGISGLSIPADAGMLLLMVFSATAAGAFSGNTIAGYAGAGLAIT